jgi:hypothetical protein
MDGFERARLLKALRDPVNRYAVHVMGERWIEDAPKDAGGGLIVKGRHRESWSAKQIADVLEDVR